MSLILENRKQIPAIYYPTGDTLDNVSDTEKEQIPAIYYPTGDTLDNVSDTGK